MPPLQPLTIELGVGPGRPWDAAFGIEQLDTALQGLFWGENVVWLSERAEQLAPLRAGVLRAAAAVDAFATRYLARPETAGDTPVPTGFEPLDAASLTAQADAARFERALVALAPGDWPEPAAEQLAALARAALRRGIVAHWFVAHDELPERARAALLELAQCVVLADGDQLVLDRADGRGPTARGALFRYVAADDGDLSVTATPAAARLGRGLAAVRAERGWNQRELARVAGVSPSAISQAERGRHALSLGVLLDLSAKLGITIDDLLRGRPAPYTLVRSDGFAQVPGTHSRVLLDDAQLDLRTTLLRVPPRGSASPVGASDSPELLLVGRGLVQAVLGSDRPVLREGDALSVPQGGVQSCRNIGEEDALVFLTARRQMR